MDGSASDGGNRIRQIEVDRLEWGRLRDWAELVRLPNVFTVVSDSVAAALILGCFLRPWSTFATVLIASILAYWAGMILNDVVDLEEDRVARPSRPLASGRISPVVAGHIANGFLLVVPIIILLVTQLQQSQPLWMGAAFGSAVMLSICIRAYNSSLKAEFIGPLIMGLCRFFNVLMIGFAMVSVSQTRTDVKLLLWFAAAIGIYIVGVTVYARREEQESRQSGLLFGLGFELVGMAILAFLPRLSDAQRIWGIDAQRGYPLLIGLIALTVIHRGWNGIAHPVSRRVQLAVKHAILTLILFDASVAALSAGPWYGAAIALLLLPAMTAGLWFRST